MPDEKDSVRLTIDGTLDLHAFSPREVKYLVPEYLGECQRLGILQVRVIHGKGSGNLRRTVHAVLQRLSNVHSFRLADETSGGWGATIVSLLPDDAVIDQSRNNNHDVFP